MDAVKIKKNRDSIKKILSSTPRNDGRLYIVNFKSKEYEVEDLPDYERPVAKILNMSRNFFEPNNQLLKKYNAQEVPRHPSSVTRVKRNQRFKVASVAAKYRPMVEWIMVLSLMGLIMWAITQEAKAREPQGEYSVLVEQGKTREDFKSEKELLKFVSDEEKKLAQEKKVNKSK